MRHFRIEEIIINDIKEFYIQYTACFLFIFKYWKKYNKLPYGKYEDALLEAKKVINLEKDYTKVKKNKTINYHYIDAFRLNRNVGKKKVIVRKEKNEANRYNKSTFIPKNITK